MTNKLRVLSIDDNHQNLSLIQQALEQHFDVISSSGEEPIDELVADCEPNIILLDIMLANTSGYDICRSIRKLTQARHIIVVFISSLKSLEDKLKAYEAGGDDYICKPVDIAELVYKLKAYEKRIFEQHQLELQIEEASEAAFTSMKDSSEPGLLTAFFSQASSAYSLDELFLATQNAIASFGLKFAIEFRTDTQVVQYPKGQISQLESEILALGKRAKRIVPFGQNRLFNGQLCSLLVKKMPADEALRTRMQEHLAILIEIINSRVLFLQNEQNRQLQRQENINALKAAIANNISHVRDNINQLEHKLDQVFAELKHTLEHENNDLNDEATIKNILNRTKE